MYIFILQEIMQKEGILLRIKENGCFILFDQYTLIITHVWTCNNNMSKFSFAHWSIIYYRIQLAFGTFNGTLYVTRSRGCLIMQSIHAGHEGKRIGALKDTSKVSLAHISYINIIFKKMHTQKKYILRCWKEIGINVILVNGYADSM